MQSFSDLVQGEHFQIWMVNGWGVGNSTENWPCLGNGERYSQGYY